MQDRVLAGRYRLIAKLGEGGMGSVWRAEHLTLHTQVAVKLIDPTIAETREATMRFQREAQASAELRSTHIVQILDYGIDERMPFIVMELLEGESLAARLRRLEKFTPSSTAQILSQVARSLSRAHQRGIVHRDLKPDNIFIVQEDADEVVKVLDFGIAKKLDGLSLSSDIKTHTGMILGTPYYMSPEQALGQTDIDHRADIWSVGIIGFECMTGVRPFERDTFGALLMAICHEPLPKPSQLGTVPAGFDDWFARSTARNKDERFQSAAEAATELRVICQTVSERPSRDAASTLAVPAVVATAVPRAPEMDAPALLETASPASVTIRVLPRNHSRLLLTILVVPALLLLLASGHVLWRWLQPKVLPVAASSAEQLTPTRSAPAPSNLAISAAPVGAKPTALAPIAWASSEASAKSVVKPPIAKAALSKESRVAKSVAPTNNQPAPPIQPQHSAVLSTNNAAGF